MHEDLYNRHPNAQKWTAEKVTGHLDAIEKDATDGPSIFLGRALCRQGLYRHIWPYWKNIFIGNEDIIEQMFRIESLFEAKILEGALKKELSNPIAALTLKFNYSWSNRGNSISKSLLFKNCSA